MDGDKTYNITHTHEPYEDGWLLWQCPYSHMFMTHKLLPVARKYFILISWASEIVENVKEMFPLYYMRSDLFRRFESSMTQ